MIVPERVTIDRTLICALSFLHFLVLFLPLYTLYDPIHTRSNNNRLLLTPNFLHSAHTLAMSPPHPHPQVWNKIIASTGRVEEMDGRGIAGLIKG